MKIDFVITRDGLTYKDAIILADDHELTKVDIEALKNQRTDAWFAAVEASKAAAAIEPPPQPFEFPEDQE